MCVVGNDTYDYKDISLIPYIPCIVMYSHSRSQMKYSRKGNDVRILCVSKILSHILLTSFLIKIFNSNLRCSELFSQLDNGDDDGNSDANDNDGDYFNIQSSSRTYLVFTRDWILSSLKVELEPKTQEKPSKVVLSPLTCMTGSQVL